MLSRVILTKGMNEIPQVDVHYRPLSFSSSFEIAAMTKNTADRLIFLGNITQQALGCCTSIATRWGISEKFAVTFTVSQRT